MKHAAALGRRQPHYVVLAETLLHDIESGRYPVSSLLPTEKELGRQFGMSRHTVREAVRRLQDLGLVSRQPGVGTRVKAKSAASRYVQSSASISDLLQYAKEVRLHVGAPIEITADEKLAALLQCKTGQRWLKYVGERHAGDDAEPICYTEVFVSYEFASIRDVISRSRIAVYALIEKHFNVQFREVRQQIAAVGIPARAAAPLGVKRGSPGLAITRHYVSSDDRVLEVAISVYPAERFSYSMRLRLDTSVEKS
jgi:DNA-binding GntR family transcriptional regulator